ncbi:MAG: beta-ketoacyl-ACP synthase III [bacterium JZ-2024 1]
MASFGITGIGIYVPEKRLTNADLAKMVDTSDEWITERTGIKERRIASKDQATSDLAAEAFKSLAETYGVKPAEEDMIVVATVTPDRMFPTTANLLQQRIGAPHIPSVDILAACTGFIYALSTAYASLRSQLVKRAFVFGAETMSRIVDWSDRRTCVLFGDGAGVVLLAETEEGLGIHDIILKSDASGADYLYMPAGGSRMPPSPKTVARRLHSLHMNGREVFAWAVRRQGEVIDQILSRNNLTPEDIKLFVLHQANYRIIEATWKKFKLPQEKFYVNIHRYGNTTAASIPLALYEAYHEGLLSKGDWVVLNAFGAGFTWGAILLRWAMDPPGTRSPKGN